MGLPNAGKSTLLAAFTAARPKIAAYPFTTLEPNLGVMDLGIDDGRRPTIADVPGLIEGASSGAGLGHAFLRHVERTRILLHVVDGCVARPALGPRRDPRRARAHDPALLEKPILVAFNKLDLAAAREAWPTFEREARASGIEAFAISADTGEGLDALRAAVARLLPDAAGLAEPPEPAGVVVHRLEAAGGGFAVEREDDAFRVSRQADRAAGRADELRERGVGRAVPAGAGPDRDRRRAAQGRHPPRERGADRPDRARVGPARGRPLTQTDAGVAAGADAIRPPAGWWRARWASWAGRSTRSTTATSRSPRTRARRWASSGSLLVPAAAAAPQAGPADQPSRGTASRWSRLASPTTRRFTASAIEIERGGPSFTVDTLEALAADGERDLWFILSVEALAGFDAWREPGRILDVARLAVVPRAGSRAPPPMPPGSRDRFPGREARVRFLPGPLLPISGSVVRRRAAAGRSIRYLVPDPVARYIADHALYSEPA